MRVLDGEATLVRGFIGEGDQWHPRSLFLAVIERLRKEGYSGATVLRGVAGFGARSVLHTTQMLRLSEDLPVLIEMVEAHDRVEPLLAILDEMIPEGLVTMEKVRIVKYSPGTRKVEGSYSAPLGREETRNATLCGSGRTPARGRAEGDGRDRRRSAPSGRRALRPTWRATRSRGR